MLPSIISALVQPVALAMTLYGGAEVVTSELATSARAETQSAVTKTDIAELMTPLGWARFCDALTSDAAYAATPGLKGQVTGCAKSATPEQHAGTDLAAKAVNQATAAAL